MASDETSETQFFWETGVAAQCDTCDRHTICKPVYDADDPLDAQSGWICRQCWYPGDKAAS